MRISIFDVLISRINFNQTVSFLISYNYENTSYICLPDLSVIIEAQKDKKLLTILNNSLLTLPDGKSIEIFSKLKGIKNLTTVSGYWLVKRLLKENLTHYFYGGENNSIKRLIDKLKTEYSNANIVGYNSLPYITIDKIENNEEIFRGISAINSLKPDIIWVGISSPKQDYLVSYYSKYLDHGIMIAVGGVFDYLSEKKKISPEWIKQIGFRWLFRLVQEPTRLWKKYLKSLIGLIRLTTVDPLRRFSVKGK